MYAQIINICSPVQEETITELRWKASSTTSSPSRATAVVSTATAAAASNTQCAIATPIALVCAGASVTRSATEATTFEMELRGHKQATAHAHLQPHCVCVIEL